MYFIFYPTVRPTSIDINGVKHHTVQGSKVVLTCDVSIDSKVFSSLVLMRNVVQFDFNFKSILLYKDNTGKQNGL